MDLKDTVKLMTSGDYKERFKAEYYQLEERIKRLKVVINQDNFKPTCPLPLLESQLQHMEDYLQVLKLRAECEGVDLTQGR